MEDSNSSLRYWIGGAFLFLVGSIFAYAYLHEEGVLFPKGKFFLILFCMGVGMSIVLFILYSLLGHDTVNKDAIKVVDPVDVDDALAAFLPKFYARNKIPCHVEYWTKEKAIVPVNPFAVEIRNTRPFYDPTRSTSTKLFAFELIVNEGMRTGMVIPVLPLDHGVEFIKKNWYSFVEWHKFMDVFKVRKDLPIASALSAHERMLGKALELRQEGYTAREINATLGQFLTPPKTPPTEIVKVQPSHSTRDTQQTLRQVVEESDEVEEAIEAYRRDNAA